MSTNVVNTKCQLEYNIASLYMVPACKFAQRVLHYPSTSQILHDLENI
jgi:hypothetical protein